MENISAVLLLAVLCSIVTSSVSGLQLYIRVNGEYMVLPGDFIVTPSRSHGSDLVRNRRSLETGTVNIDGTLIQKTPAEVFALHATLTDPIERRKVLAPSDEFSAGECEVQETITWPARCYPTAGGAMHLCRSNARGIIELRGSSCSRGIDIYDILVNGSKKR